MKNTLPGYHKKQQLPHRTVRALLTEEALVRWAPPGPARRLGAAPWVAVNAKDRSDKPQATPTQIHKAVRRIITKSRRFKVRAS